MNKWSWFGFFLASLYSVQGQAVPVLTEGVGTPEAYFATVLPDSVDPNLFYYLPYEIQMSVNRDQKFHFLMIETRRYRWRSYEVESARADFVIEINPFSEALKAKIEAIRRIKPNAIFSPVTFVASSVSSPRQWDQDFFLGSSCGAAGGPIEAQLGCAVNLNPRMARGFRKILLETSVLSLHFEYEFIGQVGLDPSRLQKIRFGLPIKMGDLSGGGYFFDQFGNEI